MGVIRVSGPLCWTLLSSDCYIITATTFVYVWATTWDLSLGIVYIKQTKRTAAQHNGAETNGHHFPTTFSKAFSWVRMHELITISLKFVPKGPVNDIPALVQIMAWRRPGDKPLSEPLMVSLPTHICVTQPQWVNASGADFLSGRIKVYFVFPMISWL